MLSCAKFSNCATDNKGILMETYTSLSDSKKLVLRLDSAGNPVEWLSLQEAAFHVAKGSITWSFGDPFVIFRGGISRKYGTQSLLEVPPVIAMGIPLHLPPPPLTNASLFKRDDNMCMYCGSNGSSEHLTRDHIIPTSKGGLDIWTNVVASCKRCNSHKSDKTLKELGWSLLAVPYAPNQAEFLFLKNRHVLADQMTFLKAQFKSDRMKNRLM